MSSDLSACEKDARGMGMETLETSVRVRKRRNREHHNSRNGCLQCKARKVKCDEEKPKCRSCNRRATPCTYANTGLNQLEEAARVSSPSPYNKPESGSVFSHVRYNSAHVAFISNGNDGFHANALPMSPPPPLPLALNMPHLQLLYHFIAFTSEALSIETTIREALKLTIPRIALSHEFLMHGIFAVAALHIAHLRPEQRRSYWERAVTHQDRALELQQDAMAKVNPDNADALFSFSLLVIYLAFASPKASGSQESQEPLAGVIQSISIIQRIRYVAPPIQQWVEEGPLAQLLSLHPGIRKSNHAFKDLDTDRYLQRFLVLCSTGSDMNKTHEFEDIEQYAAAASTLRASFLQADSVADGAPKTPQVWHWACRLTPEFLQRLGNLHPIPLVIVAHWCVILAQIRQDWWIHGWVDHTMAQIEKHLSRKYHEWLEWPTIKIQELREYWTRGANGIGGT